MKMDKIALYLLLVAWSLHKTQFSSLSGFLAFIW